MRQVLLVCLAGALAACRLPGYEEGVYDPDAGIDDDGRIERPELPRDLPNPERWRYVPAGRMKPGSIFDRFLVTTMISPIFFREEDIGFGGGVAFTDLDFRNQRGRELANIVLTYSTEGQQQYRIDWARWLHHVELEGGGILRDERSIVGAHAEASSTLTRRFFGFGSETAASDETNYTERLVSTGVGVRVSYPDPGDELLLRMGIAFVHHGLSDGELTSVPSTGDVFPEEFEDGDDVDQLWLTGGVAYDTRDSLHQPHTGWRAGFDVAAAVAQSGKKPGMVLDLDFSGVLRVPPLLHSGGDADEVNPPTDVIALGGFVAGTAGELPFYNLPSLGGSNTLRGYIQNRFTDRAAAHGSLEYRMVVVPRGHRFTPSIRIERVGLAFFYDFGTVADDLGLIGESRYLDSYGLGLRVSLARDAMFRIDAGFSEEDSIVTLAFGNAF